MAISAKLTLTSAAGDLTSSALSLSTRTTLVKAGLATAIADTSGLARTTTSAAAAGNILKIVTDALSDTLAYNSSVYEVRVYNRALSGGDVGNGTAATGEIRKNYRHGSAKHKD